MQIFIDLDNFQSITIDLYSNNFVTRWLNLFVQTLKTSNINQDEAFAGNISEEVARLRVETAVKNINQFLKREFIPWPTEVDWDDKDWYNSLHKYFEQLSGTWDHPTKLFILAPASIKSSIRDLNFYVHQLERRPFQEKNILYVSFDKDTYTRNTFNHLDYELFTNIIESGEAYINYAELGKNYIDLYKDQLPVDYPGLKNLHYYSAELCINLKSEKYLFYPDGFEKWADENSINLSNKQLGIGSISIGRVQNVSAALDAFRTSNKINNIRISYGKTI